eukprot:NODE_6_length_70510_cov_1.054395.p54 type:complete len:129 gc:universal NODE_6_length_70510_cov_1.054395:35757-36143(+)
MCISILQCNFDMVLILNVRKCFFVQNQIIYGVTSPNACVEALHFSGEYNQMFYFRIRLRNSSLVFGSLRKTPCIEEVTVFACVLETPRMTMQKCLHSTTTATPCGSKIFIKASAICLVNRSCTCNLLA